MLVHRPENRTRGGAGAGVSKKAKQRPESTRDTGVGACLPVILRVNRVEMNRFVYFRIGQEDHHGLFSSAFLLKYMISPALGHRAYSDDFVPCPSTNALACYET